jgi:hypothetical protein
MCFDVKLQKCVGGGTPGEGLQVNHAEGGGPPGRGNALRAPPHPAVGASLPYHTGGTVVRDFDKVLELKGDI